MPLDWPRRSHYILRCKHPRPQGGNVKYGDTVDMFDANQGEANKEAALERVERGADPKWMAMASSAISGLSRRRASLTTDDVWAALSAAGAPACREPRAMGAAMRAAKARGLIQPTYLYAPSDRPSCNRRPVRIWRSLVYNGE